MAFTTANLTTVEGAIIALASGERLVSFTIGDKTFSYAPTDLEKLRALRDEIRSDLGAAAGNPGYVLTSTSKGL